MSKKNKRVIPGLVTVVCPRLRIINGNAESLRKLRKPGRPKKTENMVVVTRHPVFPSKSELREAHIRDGFHLVRHRSRRDLITRQNRSLQFKFNSLCSEVRLVTPHSPGYTDINNRLNSGKVSRIERSVPTSFCSCKQSVEDEMPCLVHGLKSPDCSCGGINGITGYRMCTGHRSSGHIKGVTPFQIIS